MLQIGEMEIKRNYSPKIMKYLNSVNLITPNPYCAAGQYYCFDEAAKSMKKNTKIPIYKTGSTRLMFNQAKNIGKKTKFTAEKDDLIVWKKGITQLGHIERIYDIDANSKGWVTTIAFNVECGKKTYINSKNTITDNHKKEGVCFKRRNIYHIIGRLSVLGIIGFDLQNN